MKKFPIVLLMILFSLALVYGAEVRKEFYVTGDDAFSSVYSVNWRAQGFRVGIESTGNITISQISVKLEKEGSPPNLYINITEANATGSPNLTTSVVSTNGTFDPSAVSAAAGGDWINITMSPAVLELGKNYTILLSMDGGDAVNRIKWMVDSSSPSYPYFLHTSGNSGTSWAISTATAMFETYTNVVEDLEVTLDFPADAVEFTDTDSKIFNATLIPGNGFNNTNATFFMWNSTDLVNSSVINIVAGNVTNSTSFNISNFPFGDFEWNVLGCGTDSVDHVCTFAPNNRTFSVEQFAVEAEAFQNDVYETDNILFEVNITTDPSILSVSANLIYNGTSFVGDVSCISGTCNIQKELDIPLVVTSDEDQNKSFFWELSVFDGTDVILSNTTVHEQNVTRIHVEACDNRFTVEAMNFTAFDEQDGSKVDPFYISGTFNSWLGNGNTQRQSSFTNVSVTERTMCILPQMRNFTIDAQVEYNDVINSSVYNTRNYFFQQDLINNVSQQIPLFLLKTTASTSFILKVQDTNILPITDALIFIQRLDLATGNFSTVQVARTDDNGQTVGFFEIETVDYRFIIRKNGVTLLTTTPQKIVPESAPFTLTFTIGEDEGAPWELFEDLSNLTSTLTFNKSTSLVDFTYIDTSNIFTSADLIVRQVNYSVMGAVICNVSSTQASSTLLCDLNNVTGTYEAQAFIHRGEATYLVGLEIFKVESFSDVAGLFGVLLGFFIILVSAFAFKFNEIAGIWLINVAVIAVNIIGLISFGYLFIFGLIAVSLLITVMIQRLRS